MARLLERFERRHFVGVGREDQLADPRVRDVVLGAERVETVASFDAELRLEGARRIVDPGMDDAAVVGAGFHPRPGMALEDAHAAAPGAELRGDREPDDTSADHGDIYVR